MSQETWLAEFYPTPARRVAPQDAIAHSLRKWIGLRKANRIEHRVDPTIQDQIVQYRVLPIEVSASSCALCKLHYDNKPWDSSEACRECPLAISRGGYPCDNRAPGEILSPWVAYSGNNDPEPMIAALDKAKEMFHAQI